MTSRRRNFFRLAAALCLLLILGFCLYAGWSYCAPKRSIRALALAAQRHDRDTVEEYVDAPALADSLKQIALESYQRSMATNRTDSFMDRLFDPLVDRFADGLADAVYTPDTVITILCGESPVDAMRRDAVNYTDGTVDTFTKYGGPKTRAYGAAGGGRHLIRRDGDRTGPRPAGASRRMGPR